MKHLFAVSVCTILFAAPALFAQITVTQAEFLQIFPLGDSVTALSSSDSIVDVGQTGGPNRYDFSSLHYSSVKSYVAMGSSIPLMAPHFPNDTVVGSGGLYQAWALSGEWVSFGNVTGTADSTYVHVKKPGEVLCGFPLSYMSSWFSSYTDFDTTYSNGQVDNAGSAPDQVSSVVDGYGTLILPGGDSLQCLRIAHTTPAHPDWYFVTQAGILVAVFGQGMQPTTGQVHISGLSISEAKSSTFVRQQPQAATSFRLDQNYPNPFNPSTVISYVLPSNAFVSLKVFDVLGRQVGTLVNERQSAGSHSITFNAAALPSGVYFYRLEAGTAVDTKQLMVLK